MVRPMLPALLLLVAGCGDRAATVNEAMAAVEAALPARPPGYERRLLAADDRGDSWRLVYDISGGGTGGPLVVVINKRSGEIIRAESGQ